MFEDLAFKAIRIGSSPMLVTFQMAISFSFVADNFFPSGENEIAEKFVELCAKITFLFIFSP